jgi:hypothetical protein
MYSAFTIDLTFQRQLRRQILKNIRYTLVHLDLKIERQGKVLIFLVE